MSGEAGADASSAKPALSGAQGRPHSQSRPQPTCIIVAGMHRSGTSALTRVISLLGADLPNELNPPAQNNNEQGFWEPIHIVEIHDELLRDLGSAWDDPLPLPDRWMQSQAAGEARQKLAGALQKDFAGSRLFVLKDPRISRLLPLWLDLLEAEEIEPAIVIPVRNPLEIAASLKRRDGIALSKSLLIYLRSSLEAELASRGRPRLFVSYRELVADWRPFASKLERLVRALPCPRAEALIEIESFLRGDHYHNRFADEELAHFPDVPAVVVELHAHLSKAAASGSDEELPRTCDRARARLDEATGLFRGLVSSERDAGRREALAQQAGEIGRLGEQLSASREEIAGLEQELASNEQELARLKVKLSDLEGSTSWRLTAPLRLLGDAIKHVARAQQSNAVGWVERSETHRAHRRK